MLTPSPSEKVPIPTRAWFAMAALSVFGGFILIYMAIHGFMNNVASGKGGRVLIRSEHPYAFWLHNSTNLAGGIGFVLLAMMAFRAGYRQFESDKSAASRNEENIADKEV